MAKRPTAEPATRMVDALPVPLRLAVGVDSDPEPLAVDWEPTVADDEVGYGPGTQKWFNLGGYGGKCVLTAFGLDFERVTVGVKLPRGQNGNGEGGGDTYVSGIEDVGEVDNIACADVEVGDEVYAALGVILCRRTGLAARTWAQEGTIRTDGDNWGRSCEERHVRVCDSKF